MPGSKSAGLRCTSGGWGLWDSSLCPEAEVTSRPWACSPGSDHVRESCRPPSRPAGARPGACSSIRLPCLTPQGCPEAFRGSGHCGLPWRGRPGQSLGTGCCQGQATAPGEAPTHHPRSASHTPRGEGCHWAHVQQRKRILRETATGLSSGRCCGHFHVAQACGWLTLCPSDSDCHSTSWEIFSSFKGSHHTLLRPQCLSLCPCYGRPCPSFPPFTAIFPQEAGHPGAG